VSLSPGAHLGSYEVLSPIGAGGMGEVYRARDTKLGRDVAIKVLPAAFASDHDRMVRFQREAHVLASLNHPHIATIHGLEESDSVRALIMELVEGPTLAERIAEGAIPLEEALEVAKQIAEALEYAHEHGIVHRDLKPANVKLTKDGAVKVLDFGLVVRRGAVRDAGGPAAIRGRDGAGDAGAGDDPGAALGGAAGGGALAGPGAAGALPDQGPEAAAASGRGGADPIDGVLAGAREEAVAPVAPRPAPLSRRALQWALAGALALALALVLVLWAPWRPALQPPMSLRLSVELGAELSLTGGGPAAILSPDGAVLAFVARKAASDRPHLYVRRLDQLQASPLSGTEGADSPFFSVGGRLTRAADEPRPGRRRDHAPVAPGAARG